MGTERSGDNKGGREVGWTEGEVGSTGVRGGRGGGREGGDLFSQEVNSVKYKAISSDYVRQLFQDSCWHRCEERRGE